MEIRSLTRKGEERFEDILYGIKSEERRDFSIAEVNDVPFSNFFEPGIKIGRVDFKSRYEMGKYLYNLFSENEVSRDTLLRDPGIWNWISAFWFEILVPYEQDNKKRVIRDISSYIFRPDQTEGKAKKGHRHLVLGAWEAYYLHGEFSELLFYTPVYQHGDFAEQLSAYQDIITNKGLIEAAYNLYWDEKKKAPKRGATSRNREGSLRRLIRVVEQLDLTYDLFGMNAQEILDILPREFDQWKNK